jgi:hypothetical protein
MSGKVAMRALYLRPRLVTSLPQECRVINVPALLKELIIHASAFGCLGRRVLWQSHLIDVILDQLRVIEVAPLQLPTPDDARALRVANVLLTNPADGRPLAQISRNSGASGRTIERLSSNQQG